MDETFGTSIITDMGNEESDTISHSIVLEAAPRYGPKLEI
jgi:hypothetical protein